MPVTRPTFSHLVAGDLDWQNDVNAILDGIFTNPFPPPQVADLTALLSFDPADYEDCLCVTQDTHELWKSDGVAWRTVSDGKGAENLNGARGGLRRAAAVIDVAISPTATGIYPAGCVKLGVSGRVVTTAFTYSGGGATTQVGDGTTTNRYANAVASGIGSTFTPANVVAGHTVDQKAAAGDVTLTPDAGAFTAGKLRVVVQYIELTAPTS